MSGDMIIMANLIHNTNFIVKSIEIWEKVEKWKMLEIKCIFSFVNCVFCISWTKSLFTYN